MRGNLFAVAVDLVVLTVRDGVLCVLLRERAAQPFAGERALPGGFVRGREDLLDAAGRELVEIGLAIDGHHLEQLASYAAPDRDPRGRVLTVGHLALVPDLPEPPGEGIWAPVDEAGTLAFDHKQILADGVERARAKLEYTTLAAAFCPAEFTISQLRRVYEAVWGTTPDPRNFSRKVTSTPGFLVPTGTKVSSGRGRPGQLFRRGPATALHPPMLRDQAWHEDP
ncbi:NUDIX domain-containing protein [Pseudonocardia sp. DSM 110487]|uniref:NUDIX hydrolase n=1 Tax=Pseudonocardia sp. DSM 110487 TaxID=2865833 RepID=UPI001C69E690|nr:NUDIX domain-containing protein [Pseudonocardia sp. DSM 110487]QYN36218.1 NUDIX domain-containing protein [Pseudonocardia sp. DSM 110487]